MVTVKSSQRIFTDSEVASLTGICVEHLHNFAKRQDGRRTSGCLRCRI